MADEQSYTVSALYCPDGRIYAWSIAGSGALRGAQLLAEALRQNGIRENGYSDWADIKSAPAKA